MIQVIFLSRVLGLALIVLGLTIMIRRHYYIAVYPLIVTERMTRMVFATFALIGGLVIALADPLWQTLPSLIISLIGWMAALEGLVYLALPDDQLAKLVAIFNKPAAYIVGGLVAMIIGIYLAAIGFGLLTRV